MAALTGKDILIVDDALDMRMIVRKILEGDGARVMEAGTVQDAMLEIEAAAPHVILLDLGLPGADGFTLLEERRKAAKLRDIPVLVLSGMSDSHSVKRAISLGASDYILKPVRTTLLLQKVRKALKITSFKRHRFQPEALPSVRYQVGVEIHEISETGFLIEAPVKVAPHESVTLTCDQVTHRLDLSQVVLQSTEEPSHFVDGGRYTCEVAFIGGGTRFAQDLRTFMKEWK